jgi:hypothetical protein
MNNLHTVTRAEMDKALFDNYRILQNDYGDIKWEFYFYALFGTFPVKFFIDNEKKVFDEYSPERYFKDIYKTDKELDEEEEEDEDKDLLKSHFNAVATSHNFINAGFWQIGGDESIPLAYIADNMILTRFSKGGFVAFVADNKKKQSYIDFIVSLVENKPHNADTSMFYILTKATYGIKRTPVTYKSLEVDVKHNYNDDLPETEINNFIDKDKEGLMLFYGEPGTGKTSYIKKLIQDHPKKNFIIIEPDMLNDISSASLTDFFINHGSNSIFIVEDAEKLLKARADNNNPAVGTLLNMTDGLMSTAMKTKFICTFNDKLENIDPALIRKGRLKLKYEFKKLTIDKAKYFKADVKEDTVLAELFNLKDNDFSKKPQRKRIGFA